MSIVLTFFKKKGSAEADNFRGVTGYRGCPLSEWDYLTLDNQLKEIGLKLIVKEYVNSDDLNAPYNTIVKKPICLVLHYGDDKNDRYPDKGALTSTEIRNWILSKLHTSLEPIIDTSIIDSSMTLDTSISNNNSNNDPVSSTIPSTTTDPKDTTPENNSLLGLGLGIASTLFVAAMALVGGIGGGIMADRSIDDANIFTSWGEEGSEVALTLNVDSDDEGYEQKVDFAAKEKAAKAEEKAREKEQKRLASGKKWWEETPPDV